MEDNLDRLIHKMKQLENELLLELHKKEKEFYYKIDRNRVLFEKEIRERHRKLLKKIRPYLYEAPLLNILSAPIIWAGLIPAALLDLFVMVYQAICFLVYGIPKVKRGDYVIIDRHALSYLNLIEKINCVYCGYFNGLLAYVSEVAARTEQYWCPIKHARRIKTIHSRYQYFFDYGDAAGYREKIEIVRRAFADLEEEGKRPVSPKQ